jgi:hypothetical protein
MCNDDDDDDDDDNDGNNSNNNNNNNNNNKEKLRYKSLCIEIKRVCNLKFKIIPAVTGATRIVTKVLRNNLDVIPGKLSVDSLQKTSILETSHTIRKVLLCET